MKDFASDIDSIIERIAASEKENMELCEAVKNLAVSADVKRDESLLEDSLTKKVDGRGFDKMTIAAVDGGLVSRSLHGVDLLVIRAVGVVFSYAGGKLASCSYHPSPIVEPSPKVYYEPFHETEFETNANIERQNEEVRRAVEVVEKFRPDVMFMHGSIVPQYTTVPNKDSLLYERFKMLTDSCLSLFDACSKNGAMLAGVVEDSRGSRFCGILGSMFRSGGDSDARLKNILERAKDSVILGYLLGFMERTSVFGYSSKPQANPVLACLGGYSAKINSFCLRNAELDRPVRIDYLCPDGSSVETADKIASVLAFLSKNSMYAMPPMIVEADQRARLSEDDLELFYSALTSRLGEFKSLGGLRRSQRPF